MPYDPVERFSLSSHFQNRKKIEQNGTAPSFDNPKNIDFSILHDKRQCLGRIILPQLQSSRSRSSTSLCQSWYCVEAYG